MSGADTFKARYRTWRLARGGNRGLDIPERDYDRIFPVAAGITLPLWGRHPTPEQMIHLARNTDGSPAAIHAAYGGLPHPHAPSLTVDQYSSYHHALTVHKTHA